MENITDALSGEATEEVVTESVAAAVSSEPKLWAGKFKTVEDLEEAYKSSAKVFNENKELKDQLSRFTSSPDDYAAPEGVALRQEQLNEIKTIAKNAKLTQDQFNVTAKEMAERIQAQVKSLEDARQAVGEEKINVLKDYVKRITKAEKLHDPLMNILIRDKEAMAEALKHREEMLNTQIPGINQGSIIMQEKYEGEKELLKIVEQANRSGKQNDIDKAIRLAKDVAEARKEQQIRKG